MISLKKMEDVEHILFSLNILFRKKATKTRKQYVVKDEIVKNHFIKGVLVSRIVKRIERLIRSIEDLERGE